MCENEASGQQAVDIEAALRWADRHEARERQKLRDMGLPPEGDMPVTGAFFVRGLVAMLRTAAPTAPSAFRKASSSSSLRLGPTWSANGPSTRSASRKPRRQARKLMRPSRWFFSPVVSERASVSATRILARQS